MKFLRLPVAVALCLAVFGAGTNTPTLADPPAETGKEAPAQGPPPGDPLGPDLYIAIKKNDMTQLQSLLDKGAKIDGTNWLGITPLIWAAYIGNESACDLLLKNKANVQFDTVSGGALEAAEMGGNPRIVKRLLESGATLTKNRTDKTSIISTAAEAGHTEVLKMLIDRKVDVDTADVMGMTPLMQASRRGQLGTAQLLLGAGAKVNISDAFGRTPLMYAALNGHTKMVYRLLVAGAAVDTKDRHGDTALLLAARYSGDANIAKLLKAQGADITIRDTKNRTAGKIAEGHGYSGFAGVVSPDVRPVTAAPKPLSLPIQARLAVKRSLPLIEQTTANFTNTVGCGSCHHQGVGLITTGTAKIHGYLIDKFGVEKEKKAVVRDIETHMDGIRQVLPNPAMYKHLPAVDMEEFAPAMGATFAGLAQHKVPATEATAAVATILARQQKEDGSWGFVLERAPVQSSIFMTTAYAIRVMSAYLPAPLKMERKERFAKARTWLITTPGRNNEDRAFRLLGLKWAGAPASEIAKAAADIRAAQGTDGGWAQFTDTEAGPTGYSRSDAYATGQSLYALYVGGGIRPKDEAYRLGVEYLLRTQDDDGSWFVNKRAIPVNNYLDTGFPHGVSQYISYTGTCWATMALMFAAEPAKSPTYSASR